MTPKRTKSIFSQLPFFKGGFEGENLFKDKLLIVWTLKTKPFVLSLSKHEAQGER
jgi:hypothetical protein